MKTDLFPTAPLLVLLALAGCSTTQSDVQSTERAQTPASSEHAGAMPLPPGWTDADMQACISAGMPGPMHEHLTKMAGHWHGTMTSWMAPGMEPVTSEFDATMEPEMDGRYVRSDYDGEMPGMGKFHGVGISGYDNVAQQFVSTWIDNHSSGIMNGTGKLSPDGKTLTWEFEYSCPINKRPAHMREIDHFTGDDTMWVEMHGQDPKSGHAFQMMKMEMKRVGT